MVNDTSGCRCLTCAAQRGDASAQQQLKAMREADTRLGLIFILLFPTLLLVGIGLAILSSQKGGL